MKTREEILSLAKSLAENETGALISDQDFVPRITWEDNEGIPVAFMFPLIDEDGGRDQMALAMAMVSAAISEIASISIVMDSYAATPNAAGKCAKIDGSDWALGDMARAFENKTADAHLVYEALTCLMVDREGLISQASVPYDREDESVAFGEPQILMDSEGTRGAFPDALRNAVLATKLLDRENPLPLPDEFQTLPKGEQQTILLCTVAKIVMARTGFPMGIGAKTDGEKKLLSEMFADGPFKTVHYSEDGNGGFEADE